MSAYQCRMCGGPLPLTAEPVVTCEYCGSLQPFHSVDSEKVQQLFNRANRLRLDCEFDRAAAVYESIAAECPGEPEASWGMVLCRYGIEYVDDPATGKKVPTCHRSSYTSIWDDADCQRTLDCAGPLARKLYHREAARIEELREGILEVSAREDPYDIFICYKETDDRKNRTLDSVLAQDIYDLLTDKGYRVFFSRLSLEDKLGREYEPYIFAALNSAKIMLAVGTCFEHYDAVWVKNEWSRFLKLMEKDREKYLIPCFKDLDAYDMPREFRRLQAQDLGKVGAHQDLLRGIEKLIAPKASAEPAAQQNAGSNADALVKRGYMALEDGDWKKAGVFFNDALNQNAELAEAYWGLTLREAQCCNAEQFIRAMSSPPSLRTDSIQPVKPDATRIDDAVVRYTVSNFLPEDAIRSLYHFDLAVPSQVIPYKEFVTQNRAMMARNKNLVRAKQYASDGFRKHLDSVFSQIDSVIQLQTAQHDEAEKAAITNKHAAYQKHLDFADQKVQTLHSAALQKEEAQKAAHAALQNQNKQTHRKLLISLSAVAIVLVIAAIMFLVHTDHTISEIKSNLVGKTMTHSTQYTGGALTTYPGLIYSLEHEYWVLNFIDEETVEYSYLHTTGPKEASDKLEPKGSHPYTIRYKLNEGFLLIVSGRTFQLKLNNNVPYEIIPTDSSPLSTPKGVS